MLSTLLSWNHVLAKLGFSRHRRRKRDRRDGLTRHLRMEALEQRQMLATVNTFIGDIPGDGSHS